MAQPQPDWGWGQSIEPNTGRLCSIITDGKAHSGWVLCIGCILTAHLSVHWLHQHWDMFLSMMCYSRLQHEFQITGCVIWLPEVWLWCVTFSKTAFCELSACLSITSHRLLHGRWWVVCYHVYEFVEHSSLRALRSVANTGVSPFSKAVLDATKIIAKDGKTKQIELARDHQGLLPYSNGSPQILGHAQQ